MNVRYEISNVEPSEEYTKCKIIDGFYIVTVKSLKDTREELKKVDEYLYEQFSLHMEKRLISYKVHTIIFRILMYANGRPYLDWCNPDEDRCHKCIGKTKRKCIYYKKYIEYKRYLNEPKRQTLSSDTSSTIHLR